MLQHRACVHGVGFSVEGLETAVLKRGAEVRCWQRERELRRRGTEKRCFSTALQHRASVSGIGFSAGVLETTVLKRGAEARR